MSRRHETIMERNCRIKKRYETKCEAENAAQFYLENNGTRTEPYKCGDHYHLTRGIKK